MSMTLHSSGTSFRRYFHTGGEDLRQLYEAQKTIGSSKSHAVSDNGLTMEIRGSGKSQVIKFTK